ncbi:hypothetical protein AVEN_30486-1, partial [Araneus ventricosus]
MQLWFGGETKSVFRLESLGIYDSGVSDNREETELMMQRFEGGLELLKGRYFADLLWKSEFDTRLLGSSFTVALKRLESLIPKLEKNKWLHQCYDSVLNEQLALGIIEPCSLNDQNQNSYYMP